MAPFGLSLCVFKTSFGAGLTLSELNTQRTDIRKDSAEGGAGSTGQEPIRCVRVPSDVGLNQ